MQAFWFGLIAVLWAGFVVLEGFDFGVGVGMLLPWVANTEGERHVMLRTIGPVWGGNEVWLLVAGGATFAAFPEWYASAFSGFYLAFALLLVGLILRGIGIEYRERAVTAQGRRWCDAAVVGGSLVPSVLLGVAFADFLRGVKMDRHHEVTGGFWDLVSPYALLGGVLTLLLFAYHGAAFLALRTEDPVSVQAERAAHAIAMPLVPVAVAFLLWSAVLRGNAVSYTLTAVVAVALVASIARMYGRRLKAAFAWSCAVCVLVPVWLFSAMWPDVLPARNDSAFSLTVHNASSSHHTLVVMTVVAVLFTPIILGYQTWAYWVFRAKVGLPPSPPAENPPAVAAGAGR